MPLRLLGTLHVSIRLQLLFYWHRHWDGHAHGNGHGDPHLALDDDFAVAAAAALGVPRFGTLLFLLFLLFDVDGDYVDDVCVLVVV